MKVQLNMLMKILAYLVSNIAEVLENNSQGEEEIERAYLDSRA